MISAPKLPAKTPATGCYFFMFGYCKSIVTPMNVQLESLTSGCCSQMLEGCTGLTEITCLAQSGINTDNSTTDWVARFTGTGGTFYKHPNAVWPTGVNGIPEGWTVQDADV